jgi:arylformamidase
MEFIDISMPVKEGMPVYEGDPGVVIKSATSVSKHGVRLSKLQMSTHAGTHIDAPAHFIEGAREIDKKDIIIGKAKVCEFDCDAIGEEELKDCGIEKGDVVLLKTRNSQILNNEFTKDFAYLTQSGAEFLVKKEVRAVAIDYISIEQYGVEGHPVHKKLLSNDISIIEAVDLSKVAAGEYTIYCMPLKLEGVEAAPARCILIK